jgi:hypothetical protein
MIGIVSCRRHAARQDGCRASWMRAARGRDDNDDDVVTLFIVGDENVAEPQRVGDTLYVPSRDDYESLPQKTRGLMFWAARAGAERVFKCDDDTFVHVERLLLRAAAAAATTDADYVGFEVTPRVASGGAGYLLSRRAVEVLQATLPAGARGAEDVMVARALKRHGICIRHDSRFWPSANRVPTVWNEQCTSHYLKPTEMTGLQQSLDRRPSELLRVEGGRAGYGAIGVNGYRGFSANASAAVELPPGISAGAGDVLISAHAPSWVVVELYQPARVSGFLDAGATGATVKVEFKVDGCHLGDAAVGGDETAERLLECGRHQLDTVACGHHARRYSVWRFHKA